MRYGRLAKGGYAGWMAATDMAGYQDTLPIQETLISGNV